MYFSCEKKKQLRQQFLQLNQEKKDFNYDKHI